jgi:hypothetical protein
MPSSTSDDDKFYSRVSKAREKRLKRRREAEAANAPSARARAVARRAFLDGALAVDRLAPRHRAVSARSRATTSSCCVWLPFLRLCIEIVEQGVAQFELDFGADADALLALCELLRSCLCTRQQQQQQQQRRQ